MGKGHAKTSWLAGPAALLGFELFQGHSTVKVSERYIHPSEEAVRLAFEKVQNQQQPATISATVIERLPVSH
jgi:hypothetical protein